MVDIVGSPMGLYLKYLESVFSNIGQAHYITALSSDATQPADEIFSASK